MTLKLTSHPNHVVSVFSFSFRFASLISSFIRGYRKTHNTLTQEKNNQQKNVMKKENHFI